MRKFSILSILVIFSLLCAPSSPAAAAPWESRVDAWVLESAAQGQTEFLVMLREQADLSGASRLATKAERGWFVYQALTAAANRSQLPVIEALQEMGADYRAYWIVNAIWVRGDLSVIAILAQRPDVFHIYANPAVKMDVPVEVSEAAALTEGIEPNLTLVGAPDVWALGYTGQGAVVGGADTGYQWDHPALKSQYRGWDGSTAAHDYNWYDATAAPSLIPIDPYGHGTHTMGIMVGDDGDTHQIGMAPGARWIGCRNMDAAGYGSPETYIACYEWFTAPTRVDGFSDPRPDLAPDVINNSWSCPVSEGCTDLNILLEAVQNVRAAGILTVHSAGNEGNSGCSSINAPAAIYAESFTVGATDSTDTLAGFSSRGPITVDGSNRLKPDISAPGVSIVSAYKGGLYATLSGTSMAAPHVAGLAALLISADLELSGQVDALETAIEQSAKAISSTECSSDGVPNNLYGWGRIQALPALYSITHTLWLDKAASSESVLSGDPITYTLTLSDTHSLAPATGVVITDTLPLGTTFLSATQPYTITEQVVRWNIDAIQPGQVMVVQLTVLVNPGWRGLVINADYGAVSNEALPVQGAPVITLVLQRFLLPLTLK